MRLAAQIGLPPSEFWVMTPWQLRVCVQGYMRRKDAEHDQSVWVMWHKALLDRFPRKKKLPDLSTFQTTRKKPVKLINETGILARLKAYQMRRNEDDNSRKT